ncbi:sugar ABC transporter permease [Defluviimonas sp. 20V17]|uniref:Transport permease protein n=1 Tax=Allgaiera indica TaxID=765699 RepID=A0AAN4URQ2_9RHOB|nr:ABC transporter permease [Allgaiera indica]KDB02544.1 sugar ABC transporter permease [Defluviimonas sp. 20V17]GHE01587.1 transport permease protein [Allgaiera indica]SDW98435.1 capsular polysaccharide transport system permease protein [Allgaiera indica]
MRTAAYQPENKLGPSGLGRFALPRSVLALMLREMATTYGRSPGGYLWALIDPIGGIAILTFVFTFFLHRPPLGENFPLFYATGYLPFLIYNAIAQNLSQAILYSKPLLAYPRVSFVDALLARFVLAFLTQVLAMYLVILGIVIVFDLRLWPQPWAILNALGMAAALGAGVGVLNCYLTTAFPAWARVWAIATRPLFLISGAFFLYEGLPLTAREVLWFNPLIHVTAEMRAGFYTIYPAAFVTPAYVYLLSLVLLAAGLMLLRRQSRNMAAEG